MYVSKIEYDVSKIVHNKLLVIKLDTELMIKLGYELAVNLMLWPSGNS